MADPSRPVKGSVPAVQPPAYGLAGSPLPGHPEGEDHTWGKPYQRIDKTWWQACSDPFCSQRARAQVEEITRE